ncbi:hypothetical protein HAX54_014976, partial [Datura stramonium]|nr:hypothetical protein [Datura stramonium]
EVLNKEPGFANFEQGGMSQNDELKKEEEYDYDQDKAILKSMYHYYFNRGGIIPSPYSKELINYIEDLTSNLKLRSSDLNVTTLLLNFLKNDWRVLLPLNDSPYLALNFRHVYVFVG